jgi:hypothetical protein
MLEFFDSIPNDDKSKYKFSFTSRFFHSNGEQMMMLQNNFFLKWNESGKPLIKLFTITDITSYKEDSTAVFYVTRLNDDGTNEVVLQHYTE